MFCTKCGSEMSEGTQFCTNCGEPMTNAVEGQPIVSADASDQSAQEVAKVAANDPGTNERSTEASPQASQNTSTKKGVVVAIIVAAVIIAAAIIIGFLLVGGHEEEQIVDVADVSVEEAEESVSTPTFQSDCFQVFLPEDLADVVSFSEKNNTVTMSYVPTDTMIAMLFPKGEKLAGEIAYRSYALGEVYIGGHYEEADLELPYVGASNNLLHWGSKDSRELAVEKFMGISPDELIECIRVNTGSEYIPAVATLNNDSSSDASGSAETASSASSASPVLTEGTYAVPQEPFWGIWVGASKDMQEMVELAEKLKADGLGNAVLVNTADWSNLNSEPWWVVSLGHYDQESIAQSNLPGVQQYGYPSAYVKYSGEKIR